MGISALAEDLYFWAGLAFFVLSLAGIFWILKSLQKESNPEPEENSWESPGRAASRTEANGRTVLTEAMARPAAGAAGLETLAGKIALIEASLSKIENRLHEQNSDQMNEMAGQMKLMVQMLKVIQGGGGAESVAAVSQKVDKIYKILSALSQAEQK